MSLVSPLLRQLSIGFLSIVFFILFACADGNAAIVENKNVNCALGKATVTDGHRRLALVVGVGQYKAKKIPDLKGPPNDARRFYDLLTGPDGYGFPKENVCLLLDEEASTARFKEVFEKALVERAKEKDVVVVFYAGHGSRTRDKNGDEPDEWDETFMLHDARTGDVQDLVDDEFNKMLTQLYSKTENVTVVLDSCNSGTATRGAAGTFVARFFDPPDEQEDKKVVTSAAVGDGGAGWAPETMPGLVVFTAASDGTPALETNGRGVFTDALLQVFSTAGDQPLTYAQAARQIPPLVSAASYQIPYFQGDLNRSVFGNNSRRRPIAWEIIALDPQLKLGGPPIPGIGTGAELRIYDGTVTGSDTRDPSKAKATVVIDDMTGLNATAHISAARPDAPKLVEGDLAILVRPADEFLRIKVRLRPENKLGGIDKKRAATLRAAIARDENTKMLVQLTTGAADFELRLSYDGRLQLFGPENRIRNTYSNDASVPTNLWQHARQRAILRLQGEGGTDYIDNETLQVQLIPASKQNPCADGGWEQAKPNQAQVIPLCHAWNVRVKLSKKSPTPLLIGGAIFSTDGSMFGFPADGRSVLLKPGGHVTFRGRYETFVGSPPLGIQDRVMVFGTQETNPVGWHLLTSAATRDPGSSMFGLHRALHRYLQPGTRGASLQEETIEDTTWTLSSVAMQTEANQRFLKPDSVSDKSLDMREYTIKNFDIRPYLPDDQQTALYQLLHKVDWLAKAAAKDGIGYKQHAWKKSSDEGNLNVGIDCSRAVWFAFTRAGLRYNRKDRYLPTAGMVGDQTWMQDEFESCDGDPNLRLGDVLVYRDDVRGDGHTVMVIDPKKRIAWGSHGWDGNARQSNVKADTGVEYQLIKYKKDWERWDRRNMKRKRCWRYRRFTEEGKQPGGQPGVKALTTICDARRRCGG